MAGTARVTPSSTPAAGVSPSPTGSRSGRATHQAGPATWAAYRSHLRLHILPTLGPLPLVDIRRQHIKTLAVALGKRLSPRSVADVIMVLSMVLQEAVEDRRIPFNPCRGVRIPKGIRAERPHATAEQVAAIVARQARPPTAAHPHRRLHRHAMGRTPACTETTSTSPRQHLRPPRHRRPARSRRQAYLGPPKTTTRSAPSSYPGSSPTSSPPTSPNTPTTSSSPAPAATTNAAPTSTAAPGPRPRRRPATGSSRRSPACTSTTYATPTRPGSSKTASPKSPRPDGSATPRRRQRHLQPRHRTHDRQSR